MTGSDDLDANTILNPAMGLAFRVGRQAERLENAIATVESLPSDHSAIDRKKVLAMLLGLRITSPPEHT